MLAAVALVTVVLLRPWLFAVSNDEEFDRAVGLASMPVNLVLAVLTAVTVVLSMRTVGLLLMISALMVAPTAAAQRVRRSFTATLTTACGVGLLCSTGGVVTSSYADAPSGGTIVLLAIAAFAAAAAVGGLRHRRGRAGADQPPARRRLGADGPGHRLPQRAGHLRRPALRRQRDRPRDGLPGPAGHDRGR